MSYEIGTQKTRRNGKTTLHGYVILRDGKRIEAGYYKSKADAEREIQSLKQRAYFTVD